MKWKCILPWASRTALCWCPGARALVRLDAYPDQIFQARFLTASPVAASDLGSPIKRFAARFLLEKSDPHLLPDLSAAVIIQPEEKK